MNIDAKFRAKVFFLALGPMGIWAGIYHPYTKAFDLASRYELNVEHSDFNNRIAVADFNGDGKKETIRKWPEHGTVPANSIVIEDGVKEILRLPYQHTDGSLKTHIALIADQGITPRLLYCDEIDDDGVRQVYVWNGSALSTATANRLDESVLYGLGIGEDKYRLRDFMVFLSVVGLLPYYLVLAVWVWLKTRKPAVVASAR
ncbi:MAG: hypothetical protein HY923_05130 [Elusimicrobia bacterium]|nr:hypothetical protein [Elusimicrobiota bacterium]